MIRPATVSRTVNRDRLAGVPREVLQDIGLHPFDLGPVSACYAGEFFRGCGHPQLCEHRLEEVNPIFGGLELLVVLNQAMTSATPAVPGGLPMGEKDIAAKHDEAAGYVDRRGASLGI